MPCSCFAAAGGAGNAKNQPRSGGVSSEETNPEAPAQTNNSSTAAVAKQSSGSAGAAAVNNKPLSHLMLAPARSNGPGSSTGSRNGMHVANRGAGNGSGAEHESPYMPSSPLRSNSALSQERSAHGQVQMEVPKPEHKPEPKEEDTEQQLCGLAMAEDTDGTGEHTTCSQDGGGHGEALNADDNYFSGVLAGDDDDDELAPERERSRPHKKGKGKGKVAQQQMLLDAALCGDPSMLPALSVVRHQAKPLIQGGPCENTFCGVIEAPQWRRIEKRLVCNRCGMYHHRHGRFPDAAYFVSGRGACRQAVLSLPNM